MLENHSCEDGYEASRCSVNMCDNFCAFNNNTYRKRREIMGID
jgi:hypothetical protein